MAREARPSCQQSVDLTVAPVTVSDSVLYVSGDSRICSVSPESLPRAHCVHHWPRVLSSDSSDLSCLEDGHPPSLSSPCDEARGLSRSVPRLGAAVMRLLAEGEMLGEHGGLGAATAASWLLLGGRTVRP